MADVINVTLKESQLPSELKIRLQQGYYFGWSEEHTEGFYRVIFSAISLFLKNHASKDAGKVGIRIIDLKGNFIFGAIQSYHEPDTSETETEGEDAKGSWSLEYTFDESDFTEMKLVFDSHNNEFIQVLERQLWEINKGRFGSDEIKQIMLTESCQTLHDFAVKNCKEGVEFNLTLDGFFTITSAVEDGEVVLAMIPGAITKQAIKDDAIL